MSLFSRIVPGPKRCIVLKNWFRRSGHTWAGDDEMDFLSKLSQNDLKDMVQSGELSRRGDKWAMGWSQWRGFNEGILSIRYSLHTLSENGFHHIALRKAAGYGFATSEYLMRHNATTLWESWWRSEDLYSRNHPMLGAYAEWMAAAVAGVSLHPTTTGGRTALLWPRFPKSAATLQFASATQGTSRGEFSIAWRFVDLPADKKQFTSAKVKIQVRILVPPSASAILRLPVATSSDTKISLRNALIIPYLRWAKASAAAECSSRRENRLGFPYSWEYDRELKKWYKLNSSKKIGTPCHSYLFRSSFDNIKWSSFQTITTAVKKRIDQVLGPGLYEIMIDDWQLEKEIEGSGRIGNIPEYFNAKDLGPYCEDEDSFDWNIDDATHII